MAGTYYGTRACPAVATAEAVSSLGTSWDGPSSLSQGASSSLLWGGSLEPAPDSRCQTEMDTFRTAIAAYQAIGPNPWPEGDATTIRTKLVFAGLIQKEWRLQYNSSTTPPKANTWYYDSATHQFTSRCDA